MAHEPFAIHRLIAPEVLDKDEIVSSFIHENRIYLGTSTGSILEFRLASDTECDFITRYDDITKGSIDQMGIVEYNKTVVLCSGGNISLHALPGFKEVRSLASFTRQTASQFLISPVFRYKDSEEARIVVACRRKMYFFGWLDSEWKDPTEMGLPHQVRGMAFQSTIKPGSRLVLLAGFSTGQYAMIMVPTLSRAHDTPILGELFSPELAAPDGVDDSSSFHSGNTGMNNGTASHLALGPGRGLLGPSPSLGGLSTFAKAITFATKKLEKNQVVAVPWKSVKVASSATSAPSDDFYQPRRRNTNWLSDPKWGWVEDVHDDYEYVFGRGETLFPFTVSGKNQHDLNSPAVTQSVVYKTAPFAIDTAPPFLLTLVNSDEIDNRPEKTLVLQVKSLIEQESYTKSVQNLSLPEPAQRGKLLASTTASTNGKSKSLLILSEVGATPTDHTAEKKHATQTVWLASQVSWSIQVAQLGEKGHWKDAIMYIRKAGPDAFLNLAPEILNNLAMLHSWILFREHRYATAVDVFIGTDITPAKVVALYPRSISGQLYSSLREQEELFGGRQNQTTSSNGANGKKEEEAYAPATPNGEEKDKSSIEELIRYLTDRRQKYNKALSSMSESIRPVSLSFAKMGGHANKEQLLSIPDLPLHLLTGEQLAHVAQVVDTALFRCYLETKPVMLGPLCRLDNWCIVDEVEELLLNLKKHDDLINLYNNKGMHGRALALLKSLGETYKASLNEGADRDADDDEMIVGPMIRYLQKLGPDQLELIFEYSKWVFSISPEMGLGIFISDSDEEVLPRHATMTHLSDLGRDYCIRYLEHIINDLHDVSTEFHEKLVEMYMAAAEDYPKLLRLLDNSQYYRADRILARLPSHKMYEARAILLGRLGRHEGALQIYIDQLKDTQTAEKYCKRVYDQSLKDGTPMTDETNIFHLLLNLYLKPLANKPVLLQEALSFVSTYASFMDPVVVFRLLPAGSTTLSSDASAFVTKALRKSRERARESAAIHGICKSELQRLKEDLVGLESRSVKITPSRICPVCHKRLGHSVIATHFPRGHVTHYQCRLDYIKLDEEV